VFFTTCSGGLFKGELEQPENRELYSFGAQEFEPKAAKNGINYEYSD
jgi:hypothetical protein